MFSLTRRLVGCRDAIDRFLWLVKWPVGIGALLVLPAAVKTFERYYVIRNQLNWHNLIYFAIGAGFFAAVRVAFLMRRGAAETLEHEMTHTLFAMATLHSVHDMKINENGGGFMSFSGKGNWMIALAPYFFPLAAFAMMFFSTLVGRIVGFTPDWVYIGLGVAMGYNLFSFAEQLHPRQTDFKAAGYLFTICFLPAANCLSFGTVFAFVERGGKGVAFFYRLIAYYTKQDWAAVMNWF